ncbi:Tautomerase/MIF superfamily [Sphaerosporella brunnea]|uniref:L-dopachrome isomerase n=1 Tax=Sphaerosporella brunnea TaxID=1250544 RepID=A0A5J5F4R3_9PEZI|nr:Tautomerase/MIF superfamily [Sphaerosporella brunnea]
MPSVATLTNTIPFSTPRLGTGITAPPSPAPTMNSFVMGDDQDQMPKSQAAPQRINTVAQESSTGPNKKAAKVNISRKCSVKGADYYGEVFGVRQVPVVPKTAGVCVELKTNVILDNEFEFARNLSAMIARRYNYDESAVCVAVEHSACMIMDGNFDGTYILTITSVSLISPTVNKRNAALISEWFKANLGVHAHRGIIRFTDADFANYAIRGQTVLDLMEKEEMSRTGTTERTGIIRKQSIKRSESRYSRRERKTGKLAPMLDSPTEEETDALESSDGQPTTRERVSRKKSRSIFNLFSKSRQSAPTSV